MVLTSYHNGLISWMSLMTILLFANLQYTHALYKCMPSTNLTCSLFVLAGHDMWMYCNSQKLVHISFQRSSPLPMPPCQSCRTYQPLSSWFSLYLVILCSPEIPISRLAFGRPVSQMQSLVLELFTCHCYIKIIIHSVRQWIHALIVSMLVMAEANYHPLLTNVDL